VRAEACAGDFYAALDSAVNKMENRLRKLHDRRRVHYGRRCPESVAEATSVSEASEPAGGPAPVTDRGRRPAASTAVLEAPTMTQAAPVNGNGRSATVPEEIAVPQQQRWDDGVAEYEPGRVVREKQHSAEPMTVDQALYEMELVGHDFYLFMDCDAGKASVVYRRKGFDYGVIRMG
jgi:hypothetical protein